MNFNKLLQQKSRIFKRFDTDKIFNQIHIADLGIFQN
jgi:hypothetical protein